MRFNPVDPQQFEEPKEYSLLDPGTYKFVVAEATEKKSKSGNDMIELVLEHTDADGRTHKVWDYLVGIESAAWKTYQFCKAAGLTAEYHDGSLGDRDCEGKIVEAAVKVEQRDGYPARLKVQSYEGESQQSRTEAAMAGQQPAPSGPHQGIDEDDIPF